jgi:undecaprenyl-diphosphatase
MSYLDAVILGLIQGLTEFLPVSSSGHLVLAEHALHTKLPGVLFELLVHFGTLMSVLIYFRRKIYSLIRCLLVSSMVGERKMVWFLIAGTIPAVIVAVLFENIIGEAFGSPILTSGMLIFTGLVLLSTSLAKRSGEDVSLLKAIIMGLGQALAVFPGISRSGTTISAGLWSGVRPVIAAEFSFLLSVPAIAGAIIFKINDILSVETAFIGQYTIGLLTSFLSGLLAVYILLDIVRRGKFKYFGVYCLVIGVFGIIFFS